MRALVIDDDLTVARFLSPAPWDLRRSVADGGPAGGTKLDVALIVVESLSGEFVEAVGEKRSLTPRLDRLAPQCLVFTKIGPVPRGAPTQQVSPRLRPTQVVPAQLKRDEGHPGS
ncbi:MAG: hypothetical protein ACUVXD_15535 [Thermodesulfobacteriota bacterium]